MRGVRGARAGGGDAMQQREAPVLIDDVQHRADRQRELVPFAQEEAPAGRQFVRTKEVRLGDDVIQICRLPFCELCEFGIRMEPRGELSDLGEEGEVEFAAGPLEIGRASCRERVSKQV